MNTEVLTLKWTTSRGRDTYGYNILTLRNDHGEVVGRCMGGGYDMVGTVFGQWLANAHQDQLRAIADESGPSATHRGQIADWYGMYRWEADGPVTLDGACGIETMLRIAKALGLDIQRMRDKRGNTTGWVVQS